jgi:hypothetical protein
VAKLFVNEVEFYYICLYNMDVREILADLESWIQGLITQHRKGYYENSSDDQSSVRKVSK